MLLVATVVGLLGIGASAVLPVAAEASGQDGGNRGGELHRCTGDKVADPDPDDGVTVQWCVIESQQASLERCVQRSDDSVVVQRCEIIQSSTNAHLKAVATQLHSPEGRQGGQDATQVILVTQVNASARHSNFLTARQVADQCLGVDRHERSGHGERGDDDGDSGGGGCGDRDDDDGGSKSAHHRFDGPVTQSQEAHQTIDVLQQANGGDDVAFAWQSQFLQERAGHAASIEQLQNTERQSNECGERSGLADALDANACFSIKQSSDGDKTARLHQVYKLSQRASNASSADQNQGDPGDLFGGLEHNFDQTGGSGTPTQASTQVERLKQRRKDVAFSMYHQFAGPRKGTGLQDDPNGRATMNQDVLVSSTGTDFEVGEQAAFLQILCASLAGNCAGTQRARINEEEYADSQSGPVLAMTARCEGFEGEGEGEGDGEGEGEGEGEGTFAECFSVEEYPD